MMEALETALALTVLPLARGRVYNAEQLVVGDCFGVEVGPHGPSLHILIRLVERLEDLGFAGAGVSYHEHGVTDGQQLLQLDHLRHRHTSHSEHDRFGVSAIKRTQERQTSRTG